MFLISITQLYQYFSFLFLFALFSDEPEVFLPKYSQTAIVHAAHFPRVVNIIYFIVLILNYDQRNIHNNLGIVLLTVANN